MKYEEYIKEIASKEFELKFQMIEAISSKSTGGIFFIIGVAITISSGIIVRNVLPEISLLILIPVCFFLFIGVIMFYETFINKRIESGWLLFEREAVTIHNLRKNEKIIIPVQAISSIGMKEGNDGGVEYRKFKNDSFSIESAYALKVVVTMISGEKVAVHATNDPVALAHHKKLWQVIAYLNNTIHTQPLAEETFSVSDAFEKLSKDILE